MKINSNSIFCTFRNRLLPPIFFSVLFLNFTGIAFGIDKKNIGEKVNNRLEISITGTIADSKGNPLSGANVSEKGTTKTVQTDANGRFTLAVSGPKATLVISYVGFQTKEVTLNNRSTINISLTEGTSNLNEVVVVGYGVQKKVNLTASVSTVGKEVFENRPVANAVQSLQGTVANLQITNSSNGGQPGATSNINIRGFLTGLGNGSSTSIVESSPLILIDGVEMALTDINPEDIESVSVLKDAAAASIYGSRAAGGAIVVITKSGKNMRGSMKINYSANFASSKPTSWPTQVDALSFAYVMNDAAKNIGASDYYSAQQIDWIKQNMSKPGSAPTLVADAAGTAWQQSNFGLGASGSTDWKKFLFNNSAPRQKHTISLAGGDQKLNYYLSGGFYKELGLLKVSNESFQNMNVDAKISAKPNKWLSFELLTKMVRSTTDFPWDYSFGTGRVFDLLSKLKPTLPTVDPTFGEPLIQAAYPMWSTQRDKTLNNQLVLLPRVTIEPLKNWVINLQYNYKRINNREIFTALPYTSKLPNGTVVNTPTQAQTQVNPSLNTTEYYSPNLFTSYTNSYKRHNFKILVGYQNETSESYGLSASALNLLSQNVPSISTSTGVQTVSDNISHWSTESVFSRFNYNYNEKYLFEVSMRGDGTSRFQPGKRWASFPSFSAGYNIAKENFWPLKETVQSFKIRGSYGTLGNQNVNNYLYVPLMNISTGTYLFNGAYGYYANTPNLLSQDLTWETVQTTDFGVDISAFKNKLTFAFDWYRTDIDGMIAQSDLLPAVLGTAAPSTNAGISRVQGWETEIGWRQSLGNFGYSLKAVLSDYKRSIVSYPNPTKSLVTYYDGQDLGDVYGLQWDGWFQTQAEASSYPINQSLLGAGVWSPGDTKYKDLDGDKVISRGANTYGNTGDFSVIGNTTPRYQFSFTLGCNWKGLDLSMFIQGVGKRDVVVSNNQRFRGPAQGPLHANAYAEHLDYWRDDTSPLGANPNAYFPKPYASNPGNNNRNYLFLVDRYIQNGAYARVKNIQIGYTVPKNFTSKYKIDKIRLFVSGENLFTSGNFKFFDPETVPGNFGSAVSYPLQKIISAGLNVTF